MLSRLHTHFQFPIRLFLILRWAQTKLAWMVLHRFITTQHTPNQSSIPDIQANGRCHPLRLSMTILSYTQFFKLHSDSLYARSTSPLWPTHTLDTPYWPRAWRRIYSGLHYSRQFTLFSRPQLLKVASPHPYWQALLQWKYCADNPQSTMRRITISSVRIALPHQATVILN